MGRTARWRRRACPLRMGRRSLQCSCPRRKDGSAARQAWPWLVVDRSAPPARQWRPAGVLSACCAPRRRDHSPPRADASGMRPWQHPRGLVWFLPCLHPASRSVGCRSPRFGQPRCRTEYLVMERTQMRQRVSVLLRHGLARLLPVECPGNTVEERDARLQ